MNDETSGNPSARQRNGEIGLVIPGGSKTRDQLEDVWDEAGLRWSERRMWTLNQYMDQRASLHYDIHEHRRHWVRYDAIEAPWIVSPFIPFVDLKPRMQRFELSIILYYFGAPDCPVPLASSVDYLLARAVWLHDLQELTLGAVYLPGIDLVEESHARYLPGAMFWTG